MIRKIPDNNSWTVAAIVVMQHEMLVKYFLNAQALTSLLSFCIIVEILGILDKFKIFHIISSPVPKINRWAIAFAIFGLIFLI